MNTNFPVGVCTQMCPESEIIQREKEGCLHILEILPNQTKTRRSKADRNHVVKEFSRSAAGRKSQNVKELRTIDALLQTINYLLHDVVTMYHFKWNILYDYVGDRLRAVRQDMVIQNMRRSHCISLLQPMIKFYIYSAYRLCEKPVTIFDAVINNNHMQECLKRLLRLYDELDMLVIKVANNAVKQDWNYVENELYSKCRPFMESLYLIIHLGHPTAMHRVLRIPEMWRNNLVKKCFKISVEYSRGNYIRLCREIPKLPPLLAACAVTQLPTVRKKALITMSKAYNSKILVFPIMTLQTLLLYEDQSEVIEECKYYNIPVFESNIAFSIASFDNNKSPRQPRKSFIVNKMLSKYNIPELLLEDS